MNDGRVEVIDTRGSNHHQVDEKKGGGEGKKGGQKREAMEGEVSWL